MKYLLLPEYVKKIGRTVYQQDILWCGLSGSGAAFDAAAQKLTVTLVGDDTTSGNVTEGQARVAVYVDDIRVIDTMMDQPEKVLEIWNGEQAQQGRVQIIKLSECPMSTFGIGEITAEGGAESVEPAPNQQHRIEFIGDSITCGFGVDREDPETPFETATEDVTRAYAYKTAKLLNADYSMVSYSGYGIISGYTDNGLKLETQLVPAYYEKVGFSYGKPFGTVQLAELAWDFDAYQPELVVLNLGTNDDSYCQEDTYRQQDFITQYIDFLKVIRSHNPGAHILCTIGTMCQRIAEPVEAAQKQYLEQTGDTRVSYYRLPLQLPEEGLVSCYHPTAVSHDKAAALLRIEIRSVMSW